jgi:radical SAM superfamily enzyme YgiQ (UPF0313 family)
MSFHWDLVNDVVSTIKNINPNIKTIVGGAIITSGPELALKNMPIDIGVVGEGEETVVELSDALCTNKDLTTIKGIAFINSEKNLVITEPRPPIKELDSLPFPDYEALEFDKWLEIDHVERGGLIGLLFDIDQKPRVAEISASRSCPFRCTFCFHPLGNKYRQRSLDNVFKEIEYLKKKYNINLLNVLDELFSADEDRVKEFVCRMNKFDIYWNAQMRVDNVNDSILKTLKNSKVMIIGLGVESLSDIVLKSMKKRITKAQIEYAYNLCAKYGVRTGSNIILGDIAETEDTIRESMTWWKDHPEHDLRVGFLLAIPNSQIWKYALNHGLIKNKIHFIRSGFPVINLTKIDDTTFYKIQNDVLRDEFHFKLYLMGNVVFSKKTGSEYKGKPVYKFTINCPICKSVSTYEYYKYSNRPYSIVLCKHCYKVLKIPTKHAFRESFLNDILMFTYFKLRILHWFYLRKYKLIESGWQIVKNI